jgi:hypothetical protein
MITATITGRVDVTGVQTAFIDTGPSQPAAPSAPPVAAATGP